MPLAHPEKRTIDWLYHQNPLGGADEYVEEKDAVVSDFMPAYSDGDDEGMPHGGMINEGFAYRRVKPFIVTPGGLVPVDFYTDSVRAMELWMAHTNFPIDDEIMAIIEEVPGVESIEYATPYSVRVGFARGFRDGDMGTSKVRRDIEDELGVVRGDGMNIEIRNTLNEIVKSADATSLLWIANVMPNDNIVYAFCKDKDEFDAVFQVYKEATDAVGGVTYSTINYK